MLYKTHQFNFRKECLIMKKNHLLGGLIAIALAAAPVFNFAGSTVSEKSVVTPIVTEAATKHYYVLKCDSCYQCYSTGVLGTALMKSHVSKKHGGGWYIKSDVCTSMGCHRASCDYASNNKRYYWGK